MLNEKKLLQALGKEIKAVRQARRLTQEQLAELCDFDPTYVSLLERGQRNPPFLTICNLAEQLGCSIKQLVNNL